MKQNRNKIIMAVLIFLLAISLTGVLIFWLPDISVNISRRIHSNSITATMEDIYDNINSYVISIPITFANVICAVKGLRLVYKEKTSASKRLIGYWIYAIISSGALVVHWLTFVYVVECTIAG